METRAHAYDVAIFFSWDVHISYVGTKGRWGIFLSQENYTF